MQKIVTLTLHTAVHKVEHLINLRVWDYRSFLSCFTFTLLYSASVSNLMLDYKRIDWKTPSESYYLQRISPFTSNVDLVASIKLPKLSSKKISLGRKVGDTSKLQIFFIKLNLSTRWKQVLIEDAGPLWFCWARMYALNTKLFSFFLFSKAILWLY